MPALQQIF